MNEKASPPPSRGLARIRPYIAQPFALFLDGTVELADSGPLFPGPSPHHGHVVSQLGTMLRSSPHHLEQRPGRRGVARWSMLSSRPMLHSVVNSVMTTPLPLAEAMIGVMDLFVHNAVGHESYLLGHTSRFGWWYFFPYCWMLKTPISVFALLLLAAGAGWRSLYRSNNKLRRLARAGYRLAPLTTTNPDVVALRGSRFGSNPAPRPSSISAPTPDRAGRAIIAYRSAAGGARTMK